MAGVKNPAMTRPDGGINGCFFRVSLVSTTRRKSGKIIAKFIDVSSNFNNFCNGYDSTDAFFHFGESKNGKARIKNDKKWGLFFRRRFWANFCNIVNIFTCRCPNRSGIGAIDSPDRFEQVLDQRYIPEVSEKI